MNPAPRLNIIGCGRAASTLARLWHECGYFQLGAIRNRSLESGRAATRFLGGGQAVNSLSELPTADFYLLGVADDAIAETAEALAQTLPVGTTAIVFHLSGSQPSSRLLTLQEKGLKIASLHPVKSFAEAARAAETFAGTFCGLEGDPEAVNALIPAVEAIDGRPFNIDPSQKTLYHASMVVVCNYLNALMEAGLRCFETAGIDRHTALELSQPLVAGTVENIFANGPAPALTGPIARGDDQVIAQHLKALEQEQPAIAELYRQLGTITLDLARAQGTGSQQGFKQIEDLL